MKCLKQTLFFFLLVTQMCFAQWVQTSGPNGVGSLAVMGTNIFAAAGGVFISTDNGTNWIAVNSGLPQNPNVTALVVYDTNLFAGTFNNGVFLTTNNGTSWSEVNSGLPGNAWIQDFAVCPNITGGKDIFVGIWGGGAGIFLSTNNGTSWDSMSPGIAFLRCLSVIPNGIGGRKNLFAGGTFGAGLFRYTENDTGWTADHVITNNSVYSLIFIDSNLFASTPYSIMLSTDYGTSWASSDLTYVHAFAVSSTNIFAGTWGNGVFISTNNGTSWTAISEGLPTNLDVYALTVNELYIFLGSDGSVWRRPLDEMIPVELTSFTASANGKEVVLSWSTATELNNLGFEIQRGLEGKEFFTVGFVNGHGTTTEQQNYSYTDKKLDGGKYYYRLKQVDYDGSYEYSDIVDVDFRAFKSYLLEQNYPNPFNPTTTIGFGIQEKSKVKIVVLNSIGEEVAILLNEEKEAGYHTVEFHAASLPSGVYFYQLQAGGFVETKKMTLIK